MNAPGENLLIRLWNTVEKGLGGLLHPWQLRRTEQARSTAQREEALALAQTERDIEDIRVGRKIFTEDWKLVEASSFDTQRSTTATQDFRTLASAVLRDMFVREMRGKANVHRALGDVRIYVSVGSGVLPVVHNSHRQEHPDATAGCGLLSNGKVGMDHIPEPPQATMVAYCQCEGLVLAIQDTTTLNCDRRGATEYPVGLGDGGKGTRGRQA